MATLAESPLQFARQAHPAPVAESVRAEILANPGFGSRFTDHMVTIDWTEDAGWHNAQVLPYGPIALDPAASVLHYAQEIFEGLKAYRHPDGSMALFRPDANAERFNASARRLAMPELPVAIWYRSRFAMSDAMAFGELQSIRILPSVSSVMNRHVGSTVGLTTVMGRPISARCSQYCTDAPPMGSAPWTSPDALMASKSTVVDSSWQYGVR